MRLHPTVAVLGSGLLALSLAACLPVPVQPQPGPPPDGMPVEQARPGPVPDGMPVEPVVPGAQPERCGASYQQHLVGQVWPQPLPRNMTRVRVVREGEPMTMDLHRDRVNVILDRDGRTIRAIYCG